jgi:hypothetical protein
MIIFKKITNIFVIDFIIGCLTIIIKSFVDGIKTTQSSFAMDQVLYIINLNSDDWLLFSYILCLLYFYRCFNPVVMNSEQCKIKDYSHPIIKFFRSSIFLIVIVDMILTVIFYTMKTFYQSISIVFFIVLNIVIGILCLLLTPECIPISIKMNCEKSH